MFSAVSCCLTEIVIGSFTKLCNISLTFGGIVALKNKDWRVWGRRETKYLMSAINPMSTILSASSKTTLPKLEKSSECERVKSFNLPGVPITKL